MRIDWENKVEELKKMIDDGVSYEKIGQYYGISGNGVKKAAKRLGITLKQRRKINPKEKFDGRRKYETDDVNKRSWNYDHCPVCGNLKVKTSLLCADCHNKEKRNNIKNRTLGYYISGHTHLATKCNEIRKDARRTLEESDREKVCEYCHNHEFDMILEAHHKKSILSFDENTKIDEINDEKNLVWLCPNHHKMADLGLIKF